MRVALDAARLAGAVQSRWCVAFRDLSERRGLSPARRISIVTDGDPTPIRLPHAPGRRGRSKPDAGEERAAISRLGTAAPGPGAAAGVDDGSPPVHHPPAAPRRIPPPGPSSDGAAPRRLVSELGRTLEAPLKVSIRLYCPACDEAVIVEARLQARLTRDSDGAGAIALRTRAPKAAHICGAPTLGLAEGARDR